MGSAAAVKKGTKTARKGADCRASRAAKKRVKATTEWDRNKQTRYGNQRRKTREVSSGGTMKTPRQRKEGKGKGSTATKS